MSEGEAWHCTCVMRVVLIVTPVGYTMATHHVARGTDLKTVQVTLGHASLATATIYGSLSKRVQKKALQEHAL